MTKHSKELPFVPVFSIRQSMYIDYKSLAGIIISIYETERFDGIDTVYEFISRLREEGDLNLFVSELQNDMIGYKVNLENEESEDN